MNFRFQQKGIALFEVLVSLLIFSVGILGIVGLQTLAIRITHDSSQRSQAAWLAHEAAERMKVNPGALQSGTYQNETHSATGNLISYCSSSPSSCINASCSESNMARFDVHELMCQTTGLINQGITIACSSNPCVEGSNVDITVSWDSRAAVSNVLGSRQQLSIRMRR